MDEQQIEVTEQIIVHAKELLQKGDSDSIYLANYVLRNMGIVRRDNGLSDLALTQDKCGNLSKNDVYFLIELIEKQITKSKEGDYSPSEAGINVQVR